MQAANSCAVKGAKVTTKRARSDSNDLSVRTFGFNLHLVESTEAIVVSRHATPYLEMSRAKNGSISFVNNIYSVYSGRTATLGEICGAVLEKLKEDIQRSSRTVPEIQLNCVMCRGCEVSESLEIATLSAVIEEKCADSGISVQIVCIQPMTAVSSSPRMKRAQKSRWISRLFPIRRRSSWDEAAMLSAQCE